MNRSYSLLIFYSNAMTYAKGYAQLLRVIKAASQAAGLSDEHAVMVNEFATLKMKAWRP